MLVDPLTVSHSCLPVPFVEVQVFMQKEALPLHSAIFPIAFEIHSILPILIAFPATNIVLHFTRVIDSFADLVDLHLIAKASGLLGASDFPVVLLDCMNQTRNRLLRDFMGLILGISVKQFGDN